MDEEVPFQEELEEQVKSQIRRQISLNPNKYKRNKFYMDDNYQVTLDQVSVQEIL